MAKYACTGGHTDVSHPTRLKMTTDQRKRAKKKELEVLLRRLPVQGRQVLTKGARHLRSVPRVQKRRNNVGGGERQLQITVLESENWNCGALCG
jgi:hypothetical protein